MHRATIKALIAMVDDLGKSTGDCPDDTNYTMGYVNGYDWAIALVLSSLKDLLKEKKRK